MQAWTDDKPVRLGQKEADKSDPDPKAIACYGLLRADTGRMLLRFVNGRPISSVTVTFLSWLLGELASEGKAALLMIWDNASWHISRAARAWIRTHNRAVKRDGQGVRILVCCLPVKSPWLNPIEPKWAHSKRAIVEPTRLLSAQEVAERVCADQGCPHEPHLTLPDPVLDKAS